MHNNFKNWTHTSYDKIPETTHQWNLTESDYRAFKKTDWVVTEKIHGANFCIITDGSETQFAKRKELLQSDEDFFGYHSIKSQLSQKVKEIFKIIQSDRSQMLVISVYGELFGGEYPHPDAIAVANVQAIQTGVYYSPNIEFCAFDIAVEESDKRDYLDYDKALKIFHQVGLICAEPLFMGKYEDALSYNIDFESTIPTLLGLPKLSFPNKAEGVVIKPVKTIYADTPKGKIRPILKRKISEFAEDSRFHQATNWNYSKVAQFQSYSTEEELRKAMLALATENRLNNVISKIGRFSAKNKQVREQIFNRLLDDVLESFNENYEKQFSALPDKRKQAILEELQQILQKILDNRLKKL